jgi:hypothetical protein
MKMTPSETAGTENLSIKVTVHWGERSQCGSKHCILRGRKSKIEPSFNLFGEAFWAMHASRSAAIELELPGDDHYHSGAAVAGRKKLESALDENVCALRASSTAIFLIILKLPEQCALWQPWGM